MDRDIEYYKKEVIRLDKENLGLRKNFEDTITYKKEIESLKKEITSLSQENHKLRVDNEILNSKFIYPYKQDITWYEQEVDRLEKENYRLRIELATTKATLEVLYERLTRVVVDVKKKIAQAQAINNNE